MCRGNKLQNSKNTYFFLLPPPPLESFGGPRSPRPGGGLGKAPNLLHYYYNLLTVQTKAHLRFSTRRTRAARASSARGGLFGCCVRVAWSGRAGRGAVRELGWALPFLALSGPGLGPGGWGPLGRSKSVIFHDKRTFSHQYRQPRARIQYQTRPPWGASYGCKRNGLTRTAHEI